MNPNKIHWCMRSFDAIAAVLDTDNQWKCLLSNFQTFAKHVQPIECCLEQVVAMFVRLFSAFAVLHRCGLVFLSIFAWKYCPPNLRNICSSMPFSLGLRNLTPPILWCAHPDSYRSIRFCCHAIHLHSHTTGMKYLCNEWEHFIDFWLIFLFVFFDLGNGLKFGVDYLDIS